jgi:Immunoglobulin domain
LSVHGTITSAGSFMPAVTNNYLTVAQWWPHEITRLRGIGIWINYRRENAAPLWVADNVIETPNSAPLNCTIRGLEALTLDGNGTVTFARNIVYGDNNCHQGICVNNCGNNNAVQVLGGSLNGTLTGALAVTLDPDFGAGDAFITLSNVNVSVAGGGTGVLALQDNTTPNNHARVNVLANSVITGGLVGVGVHGTNAAASILNNAAPSRGNSFGVVVDNGRALIENNDLTGNSVAAIRVEGAGTVDAGDCAGADITGLATGSGPNGSSAGLNKVYSAGYPFAGGPLAIRNVGYGTVFAQNDDYGATSLDDITSVLNGPVSYAQGNGTFVLAPAAYDVECVNQIPPGATSLSEFFALGGFASANPATLTFSNYPANPLAGNQTVYRSYFITDACGRTASCIQTINVIDPAILAQPVGVTTPAGSSANFSLVAAGTPVLGYQWYFENVAIPGATTSAYSIAHTLDSDSGSYSVVVTNVSGAITSTPAILVVTHPPVIVQHPVNVTTDLGQSASFTVNVSGATPFGYAWQKNGNPIPGATARIFTIPAVQARDAAAYNVVVTNLSGSETSQPALLSLITSQPQSLTQISNSTATFTVVVTGLSSTYQWKKNGSIIAGATTTILRIPNIGAPDAATYSVVINNSAGSATSANATLTVVAQPTLRLLGYSKFTRRPTLSVSGSDGFNYAIRASTNFVDWLNLVTNPVPYNFTDTGAMPLEHRFYQGFWVP